MNHNQFIRFNKFADGLLTKFNCLFYFLIHMEIIVKVGGMVAKFVTQYVGNNLSDTSNASWGADNELFQLTGPGDKSVNAGVGNDFIADYGYSGNDYVVGGYGSDLIKTGSGNDVVFGGTLITNSSLDDADFIVTGSGNDFVFAGSGNDWVNGEGNDDYIHAGTGDDTVIGGLGSDSIWGGEGNDVLYAGVEGASTPISNVGVTLYYDGVSNNWLSSSFSASSLSNLGAGYLTATADGSSNYIDASSGNDLVVGSAGNDALLGGMGLDTILGGDGTDGIDGGGDRDIIDAGAGNDYVLAGAGNDYVDGSDGNDEIFGEDGDDLIISGKGNGVLYGGDGSDIFYFRPGDGGDVIMDFVAGSKADAIALAGTGLSSFAEVQSRLGYFAAGNATFLQIGSDQIFFSGITPGQLDASDFLFF